MLFNSLEFLVYLPIVFVIYWLLANHSVKSRNAFLFLASYVFYGWWDYRFLALIFFSTCVDYFIGLKLDTTSKKINKKILLMSSVAVNIGLLGFFKYYDFFVQSFVDSFRFFGQEIAGSSLNIILPVGISFYTFQTLSYTIDIYRGQLKPSRDFMAFGAFVSFFPQLVAGPIERASNLLPQFSEEKKISIEKLKEGLRQILWGLFKKLIIADQCAVVVNEIFSDYSGHGGGTLLVGSIFFAFQIYGDFSGYSDIAIGTAKLFDFKLMRNFNFPYFSRDIAEFWRKWHISLSTWFRDYVYISIGGSRSNNKLKVLGNVFVIFILSGFWHGANWTFIVWGALNAIYYIPYMLLGKNRKNLDVVAQSSYLPGLKEFIQMLSTFFATCVAWVFFRSESVTDAVAYLYIMFKSINSFTLPIETSLIIALIVFVIWEWFSRKMEHGLQFTFKNKIIRWLIYVFLILLIAKYHGDEQEFIYFQF